MTTPLPVNAAAALDPATLPDSSGRCAPNPMLHAPILPLLIRLAVPTVAVMLMQTVLSVAETYFVSGLGVDAIAAASLVVPVMLLMTMVSNGGVGGGVSSAVARALGAGRQDEAESLAWHSVVIAIGAGGLFAVVAIAMGPTLYRGLGGTGASLQQALQYSNILFGGAVLFWVSALLQSALRGAGNVRAPALIMLGGVGAGLIVSPLLILGSLGLPRMGVAGAGVAQVLCTAGSVVAIVASMRSTGSKLRLRRYPLRRDHFEAILGVGLLSTLNAAMSTLSMAAITAAAGTFSVATIAGYGIASRLEILLVPVMFGFGTAAIAVVGTCIGAGDVARARRAALVNALFVGGLLEVLGLSVACLPGLWMSHFTSDPDVSAVGGHYLMLMGPAFGFIAITLSLYFAGQGARRVGWPLAVGGLRFACALLAAALVFAGKLSLESAFLMVAGGAVAGAAVTVWGFAREKWGGC